MYANAHEYTSPLAGDIDTLPMDDSLLVVLHNLGFRDQIHLNKDSVMLLREFPHKHHVHMKT